MMKDTTVCAVIFDMDGLMLDTEVIARAVWAQAFGEAGLPMREDIFSQVIGRTSADMRCIFGAAYGLSESAFGQISRRKDELLRLAYEKNVPVKDGLFALLDELDARRIPRAVATSTYRELALHKLGKAGLAGRFDGIVAGDEVGRGKPAPDIFLAAAQKIHQPPRGCVVLEDSAAGALGAVAAGMRVIIVPDQISPPPDVAAQAWRVCGSLGEVKDFLFAGEAQPLAPGA